MPDFSDSSAPGDTTLVIPAVFVPEGHAPPAEFAGSEQSIRIPATFDPRTGIISTDDTGPENGDIGPCTWQPVSGDEDDGGGGIQTSAGVADDDG